MKGLNEAWFFIQSLLLFLIHHNKAFKLKRYEGIFSSAFK